MNDGLKNYFFGVLTLINKARSALNIYLGSQQHEVSETYLTYLYPNYPSGRQDQLQAIAGQYPINDQKILTLLDLECAIEKFINDASNYHISRIELFAALYLYQTHLSNFVERLENIKKPMKGFPPLKKGAIHGIEVAKSNLENALRIFKALKLRLKGIPSFPQSTAIYQPTNQSSSTYMLKVAIPIKTEEEVSQEKQPVSTTASPTQAPIEKCSTSTIPRCHQLISHNSKTGAFAQLQQAHTTSLTDLRQLKKR